MHLSLSGLFDVWLSGILENGKRVWPGVVCAHL